MQNVKSIGCVDSGKKSTKKDVMLDVESSLISLIDDTPRLLTVWLEDAEENDDGSATVRIFDSLSVEATAVVVQESAKTALALIGKPVSVTICNKGTDCMPEFSVRDIDYDVSGERLGVDPADLYDETVGRLLPKLTTHFGAASYVAAAVLLDKSSFIGKASDASEEFDYEGGLLDRMDRTLSTMLTVCERCHELAPDENLLISGAFFSVLSGAFGDSLNRPNMYIPGSYNVIGLISSASEKLGVNLCSRGICELIHIIAAASDYCTVEPQSTAAKIVKNISGTLLYIKECTDILSKNVEWFPLDNDIQQEGSEKSYE